MGRMSDNLEWTPRTRFVEVFLNEVYQGSYQLTEHVKVSTQRVNVTSNGYLIEVDQLGRMEPSDVYFQTARVLFNIKAPDVVLNDEKYAYIKDYVTTAEAVLYGNNFAHPTEGYSKYLDVDSFIDWFLINEIAKNNDAIFYSSCFMNLAPGGKLKMGPIWDFDIGFGNVNYGTGSNHEGFHVKNARWIVRLFQDPSFVEKVKARYDYFYANKYQIIESINRGADNLKWSVIENNQKWKTLYSYTWPNYAIWGSYDNEIIYMKNWLSLRMDWLKTAL